VASAGLGSFRFVSFVVSSSVVSFVAIEGISPHHAMQVAERLYTSGFISYPRTETTQYADNADLK
jgi:DNA topoisomerase III